jgi:hypothetical protein
LVYHQRAEWASVCKARLTALALLQTLARFFLYTCTSFR